MVKQLTDKDPVSHGLHRQNKQHTKQTKDNPATARTNAHDTKGMDGTQHLSTKGTT